AFVIQRTETRKSETLIVSPPRTSKLSCSHRLKDQMTSGRSETRMEA
ncbi:hypothetical protein LINGRAHAP2_LOCUS34503, partial [Linum grandiflorum]